MTIENIWLAVVAGATSVASVVGFLIQIWSARKANLEIEKLKLEIDALKKTQRAAGSRIALPTSNEINEIILAQRQYTRDKAPSSEHRSSNLLNDYGFSATLLAVLAMAGYILWKHFAD